MSTQVRTWTEYCGAEGEPSRWVCPSTTARAGGYIEKTAEGFDDPLIHTFPSKSSPP